MSPEEARATAAALIDRSVQTIGAEVRSFRLTEWLGEDVLRRGELTLYPSPDRPVFDLEWTGGGVTDRVRSDGTTVYARDSSGEVDYSTWSEAGSVLYGQRSGKLVTAAVDPSGFIAYGPELSEGPVPDSALLSIPLPTGGGWELLVSTESWLPISVRFTASSEADVERLDLEPLPVEETVEIAEMRLEPEQGASARRFYAGPAPGDAAPAVTFQLADGSSVTLADHLGSVVVVDFWATWCGPCRPAMQKLEELYQEHRDDGLVVYGLRLFDSGDATAFLDSLGISYPIGDGTPFAESYAVGTYGLPALYLIDREGRIGSLIVGYSQATEEALVEAVEQSLAS